MSKSPDKHVPKHRAPGKHKARRSWSGRAPVRVARTTIALTGLAAAVTGVSVAGGVLTDTQDVVSSAAEVSAPDDQPTLSAERLRARGEQQVVSRSDRRGTTDPAKAAAVSVAQGHAVSRNESLSDSDPRDIARALLPVYGFADSQFGCLDSLYVSESDWRVNADNPTSSAYGIPQALTQLHDLPADYMTSAESQLRWGLEYIKDTYGTPCSAWEFKRSNNWY